MLRNDRRNQTVVDVIQLLIGEIPAEIVLILVKHFSKIIDIHKQRQRRRIMIACIYRKIITVLRVLFRQRHAIPLPHTILFHIAVRQQYFAVRDRLSKVFGVFADAVYRDLLAVRIFQRKHRVLLRIVGTCLHRHLEDILVSRDLRIEHLPFEMIQKGAQHQAEEQQKAGHQHAQE